MDVITQVTMLLLFVAVPVAIVVWLARATRLPACPNCHYRVSDDDVTCRNCGCSLTPSKTAHGGSVTQVEEEASN